MFATNGDRAGLAGKPRVKQSRNRIDRRRGYRHEAAGAAVQRPRAVAVTRAETDKVVVHVHVHNEVAAPEEASARPRRRTGANTMAAQRRPMFSGKLFGWKEHYEPIAKRMAPLADAAGSKRDLKLLATRLSRVGVIIAALVTVVAVGCRYL
jgi:hypothetical protein